ncbi:PREDICTED: uncharacterized protein LOC105360097 [Ceratosolen solmsi marchali]|uniref:Uncharacterized protein LOC105360097 n=1 Tax=Ceratosolen solmsi marchali TaxID=326594 RepID=A0AAJ6VL14_9HYME|nr:PREDICTED: uncharacterized protein LOC105360097 [Ceratosolen solmsi marchali]
MVSGHLNMDVCSKIFLRMVRCYRESYYLLERATDNARLLRSVNSTHISNIARLLLDNGEYESTSWPRRIYVPEALAPHFFESNVASTVIGSLVEFIVDSQQKGETRNDGKGKPSEATRRAEFLLTPGDSRLVPKAQIYLTTVCPKKFGGSHESLRSHFPKSEEFFAFNVFPAASYYEGTPYASISKSQMPAIAMLERDYRALRKLRFEVTGTYCSKQRELLCKGEFWLALIKDISDILAVSALYRSFGKEFANYSLAIVQMLLYCKDESLSGLTEASAVLTNGRLISQEQYNLILKRFKLKHEIC